MVRCGACLLSSSARWAKAALLWLRARAFVPGDLQLLARGLRVPPGFGDDGDAVLQAGIAGQHRVR